LYDSIDAHAATRAIDIIDTVIVVRPAKLLFDRYETAGRSSAFFDQKRHHDHFHTIFGNLVAIDQTLATSHRLLD
jgi:hypothetical protein